MPPHDHITPSFRPQLWRDELLPYLPGWSKAKYGRISRADGATISADVYDPDRPSVVRFRLRLPGDDRDRRFTVTASEAAAAVAWWVKTDPAFFSAATCPIPLSPEANVDPYYLWSEVAWTLVP